MIFYMLGLLSYYKLANKPVPLGICLAFFAAVTIVPGTALFLLVNTHWIFQVFAFGGGFFCWTFLEYFTHRFLLHGSSGNHLARIHTSHHSFPEKTGNRFLRRLISFMPALFVIQAAILFSVYLWFFAGILSGYALYGYLHTRLHSPGSSKWLDQLQHFHQLHHASRAEYCFGLCSRWWDWIFNTVPAGSLEISLKSKIRRVIRKLIPKRARA